MELGVDLGALAAWMRTQGLGDGPISGARRLSGGTQNILVHFFRDGRPYVLRRPPAHPRSGDSRTMLREARVLGALAGSSVPHAALISACDDEAVLGAAFYLMEPVDGFNPTPELPELQAGSPPLQHRMGLALVEALATLGAIDHVALGLADFGKPEGYLERQVARWQSQLDGYREFAEWPGASALGDVAAVGNWLEKHRPVHFTPGIMHGDYHMANVMFRHAGAEMAAIVDWELATIGDPLVDLGWLLATWPDPGGEGVVSVKPWIGFPTAGRLVAHYQERSARDLTAMQWYAVFACYKLGILLEGTYARACAGKAAADVGARLHARSQWLFERAGRWIEYGLPATAAEGCSQQ